MERKEGNAGRRAGRKKRETSPGFGSNPGSPQPSLI